MVNEEENTRKIVWTNTAKQDLYKIYQRVEAESPEEAKNIVQAVLYTTEQLLENPHQGKVEGLLGGEKKSYKFITAGFYKILHNFEGNTTFIRSIFHLRQMPEQNKIMLQELEGKAEKIVAQQRIEMEALRAEQARKAEEERAKKAAQEAEMEAQAKEAETTTSETEIEEPKVQEEILAQEAETEVNQTQTEKASEDTSENLEQDMEDIDALLAKLDEQAKQMGE